MILCYITKLEVLSYSSIHSEVPGTEKLSVTVWSGLGASVNGRHRCTSATTSRALR